MIEIKDDGSRELKPLPKLLTEAGPLVVFFAVYSKWEIFTATAVFMVLITASLIFGWVMTRKLATMPLISAVLVGVFGGLTLYLQDEMFIKLKPTIIYALFAIALLGGLAINKPLLKPLMEAGFPPMMDEGWRTLTMRFGLFFVFLAVLNEIVWRNFSTDTWVSLKVFGFLPLTFVFMFSQVPTMNRFIIDDEADEESS